MAKGPDKGDMTNVHQLTKELVEKCHADKHLALAILFAASNLAAGAAESDPINPSKALKDHLKWHRKHTTEIFQRFVRNRRRLETSGRKFDA